MRSETSHKSKMQEFDVQHLTHLTSSPRHFRQHFTAANCSDGRWVSCSHPKIIQNQWLHVVSNSYKSTTENDVNCKHIPFILTSLRSQAPEQPWGGTYAACADHLPFDWVPSALAQRSAQVTGIHGFFSQSQVGDPPDIDGPWGILSTFNHQQPHF